MTHTKLDEFFLGELNLILDQSIRKYSQWYLDPKNEITFVKQGALTFTPDKPNSARTVVSIQDKFSTTDMYVIVFQPGDGTGDQNTFKLEELNIPKYLQFKDKPERVLPRKKTCEWETMIPFGSVVNGIFYENFVSLEELTVDDTSSPKNIVKLTDLGLQQEEYQKASMKMRKGCAHNIIPCYRTQKCSETHFYTTGQHQGGKRFGDPHAVFNNPGLNAIQMVGFVSYPTDSILYNLFGAAETNAKRLL